MSPWSAAIGGALISGLVLYAASDRAPRADAFTQPAQVEYVQTVDGRLIPVAPAAPAAAPVAAPAPAAVVPVAASAFTNPAPSPVVERQAPRQTVSRPAPVRERVVVEQAPEKRSWRKTALVIGGSSAAGAGVGGLIHGGKGALIGAAIGGGAASIYEATKR